MAPLRQINKTLQENIVTGIKTRSHVTSMKKDVLSKRKADESPLKRDSKKRSALVDIKNVRLYLLLPLNALSNLFLT